MKKLLISVFLTALLVPSVTLAAFDRDLSYGSKGDDVRELQELLTTEGVYNFDVTGNFYAITRKAVRDFQAKHGLVVNGSFKGATRQKANELIGPESPTHEIVSDPAAAQLMREAENIARYGNAFGPTVPVVILNREPVPVFVPPAAAPVQNNPAPMPVFNDPVPAPVMNEPVATPVADPVVPVEAPVAVAAPVAKLGRMIVPTSGMTLGGANIADFYFINTDSNDATLTDLRIRLANTEDVSFLPDAKVRLKMFLDGGTNEWASIFEAPYAEGVMDVATSRIIPAHSTDILIDRGTGPKIRLEIVGVRHAIDGGFVTAELLETTTNLGTEKYPYSIRGVGEIGNRATWIRN